MKSLDIYGGGCKMFVMDKKSKILLVIVILSVLTSVGFTFYKTVILQNFEAVNTEINSQSE